MPPARKRPVIRLLLLIGIGIGLYFGFEPGTRQIASWLKKSPTLSSKNRSPSKPEKSIPDSRLEAEIEKPSWVFNRDSSQITLNCPAGEISACLQGVDSARPGLANWLSEAMARNRVNAQTMGWSVTCKFPLDSGLAESGMASLLRLSLGSGSGKKVYLPRQRSQGWSLCPETGCEENGMPRLPIAEPSLVRFDKDKACLRVEGMTALLAPAAGWVSRRDTVAGKLRLVLDHAAFCRSVFTGDLILSPEIKRGKPIALGQRLGQTLKNDSKVTVLWLAQGSPTLPSHWQVAAAPETEENVP